MLAYPIMNSRLTDSTGWFRPGWNTMFTIFSNEQTLLYEACTSVSDYIKSTTGIVSAIQYWEAIGSGDDLYEAAQTQIYLLRTPSLTNLLANGTFVKQAVLAAGQAAAVQALLPAERTVVLTAQD